MLDGPVVAKLVRPVYTAKNVILRCWIGLPVITADGNIHKLIIKARYGWVVQADIIVAIFQFCGYLGLGADIPSHDRRNVEFFIVDKLSERTAVLIRHVHPVQHILVASDGTGGISGSSVHIIGAELLI